MWQNPYANPNPVRRSATAAVWFTAYPLSLITKPGHSFLGTLADPDLWEPSSGSASRRCTPGR